uniref:Uncharacterized protein n=1 Tax=Romanomermis culicivorax TaxID=13658 RepID=A0A915IZ13_ROMCU
STDSLEQRAQGPGKHWLNASSERPAKGFCSGRSRAERFPTERFPSQRFSRGDFKVRESQLGDSQNTRFSMTKSIFAIFLAILSLMIMQSAGQRCEMLDSWKTMEGTVAFTAISWSSISDAVLTNDNGDYNLQKVFTKANNCWANRNYRLHFGKTECQPFEQAVVPAVGDMSWDSAGNAHSSPIQMLHGSVGLSYIYLAAHTFTIEEVSVTLTDEKEDKRGERIFG